MHIIYISWWWPYPANNGAKIRIYNLLRQLAAQHTITLLSFAEPGEADAEQVEHMQQFCREVTVFPRPHPRPNKFELIQGYLSAWPRSLFYNYCPEVTEAIEKVVATHSVDLLIGSQVDTMRYLQAIPNLPAIMEEVEMTILHNHVQQAHNLPQRFRAQLPLIKLEHVLTDLMRRGVVVTVVSEQEKQLVESFAPNQVVYVIPNGVDTVVECPDDSHKPKPYSLIYTGAITYRPNFEAVAYFVRDVWPLVLEKYPQAQFTVTGSTGNTDISKLSALPGVHFVGYLPSVRDAVRESWAMVVPLKHGGGTRLKILEAMAIGTPVISTAKGAEGLAVQPDENLLIANDTQAMVDAISRLFEDAEIRSQLAAVSRNLVEKHYDWSVIGQSLLNVVDQVAKRSSYGHPSPNPV